MRDKAKDKGSGGDEARPNTEFAWAGRSTSAFSSAPAAIHTWRFFLPVRLEPLQELLWLWSNAVVTLYPTVCKSGLIVKVKGPCALLCKTNEAGTHVCFVTAVENGVFTLKSKAFDAILTAGRCFMNVRHLRGGVYMTATKRKRRRRSMEKVGEAAQLNLSTVMTFLSPSLPLPAASLPI